LSVPLAIIDEVFARVLNLPKPALQQNPLMAGCVNLIAFGGAIALGLFLNRLALRKAFPLPQLTLPQVGAVAVTILGGDILLSEADNLFRSIATPPQWLLDAVKEMFSSEGNLVARIFLLVIVAPVTEELLFRGVILRGLLSRYRPAVAVLLAAFLFAAVHMNPWQFFSAFWLGVAFGWFFLRTGSVKICIVAHAMSNGLFVLFTSLPMDIPGLTSEPDFSKVSFQPWWLDLTGALLLLAGVFAFRAATRVPRAEGNSQTPGQTPATQAFEQKL
jgi:membrane protease YdiL (CAAX protease family)